MLFVSDEKPGFHSNHYFVKRMQERFFSCIFPLFLFDDWMCICVTCLVLFDFFSREFFMMFTLYRLTAGLLFYPLLPLLLLFVMVTGKHKEGILQRFAIYPVKRKKGYGTRRYWVHAASVGEVQAASAVIEELRRQDAGCEIFLTTMTIHGNRVAREKMPSDVGCFLAPLDVAGIVGRAVHVFSPDVYICLETELWPLLIDALSRRGVVVHMINGRISARSYTSYLKIKPIIKRCLSLFTRIAVISENDRIRLINLGAIPANIRVFGNIKYDFSRSKNSERVKEKYSELLDCSKVPVFIAGSTHSGEEELLIDYFVTHLQEKNWLFLLAPRHIERVGDIEKILKNRNICWQRLSSIKQSGRNNAIQIIVVDSMGELALLYGVGSIIFCGGSLVDKGGHNIMEIARWHKPPFYGPEISDFADAAQLLEGAGGGFRVADYDDLVEKINYYSELSEEYMKACDAAGKIADSLQGACKRQVDYVCRNEFYR